MAPPLCTDSVKSSLSKQDRLAPRHTSAEFVAFLTDVVLNPPRGQKFT
jgi:hypothetical protein